MPAAICSSMINCQPEPATPTARVAPLINAAMRTLRLWRSRSRQRHAIPIGLDERQLHDLRLSRWELDRELRKPFWRE